MNNIKWITYEELFFALVHITEENSFDQVEDLIEFLEENETMKFGIQRRSSESISTDSSTQN